MRHLGQRRELDAGADGHGREQHDDADDRARAGREAEDETRCFATPRAARPRAAPNICIPVGIEVAAVLTRPMRSGGVSFSMIVSDATRMPAGAILTRRARI